MPKKFKRPPDPEVGEVPAYLGFTPNQVVAYNLTRAREHRGWTQDEAAEALAPYLGTRWSKASFSQAERSVAGRSATSTPMRSWPSPGPSRCQSPGSSCLPAVVRPAGVPVKLATPDAEDFGTALGVLVDLVFGDPAQQALLRMRLDAFLDQLGPLGLTDAQQRIASAVNTRVEALVAHSFRGLGRWQTMLRSVANQLEDLERRAKGGRTSEEEGLSIDELVARHLGLDDEEDTTDERGND